MRPAFVGGLICGIGILLPLLVPICLRVFSRDRYAERWGRYEYTIFCNGSYVCNGSSFRKENPEQLDEIAGRILTEWFYEDAGDRALLYDSHRERYRCVIMLQGYGGGEAFGR